MATGRKQWPPRPEIVEQPATPVIDGRPTLRAWAEASAVPRAGTVAMPAEEDAGIADVDGGSSSGGTSASSSIHGGRPIMSLMVKTHSLCIVDENTER